MTAQQQVIGTFGFHDMGIGTVTAASLGHKYISAITMREDGTTFGSGTEAKTTIGNMLSTTYNNLELRTGIFDAVEVTAGSVSLLLGPPLSPISGA